MKQDKMMICSIWQTCTKDENCPVKKPHHCDEACRAWESDSDCPYPCIPYEPKHCTAIESMCGQERALNCNGIDVLGKPCSYWKNEQPPQMPLLSNEEIEETVTLFERMAGRGIRVGYEDLIGQALAMVCIKQDERTKVKLQAHDSAIASKAVKEFAEKIPYLLRKVEGLANDPINNRASSWQWVIEKDELEAHIRAMAKGGR